MTTGSDARVRDDIEVVEAAAWLLADTVLRSVRLVAGALTLAQFRLLAAVGRAERAPARRLAEALRTSSAAVNGWSERLVVLGYATRSRPDGPDGEVVVSVTPAGRQVVARVSHRLRQELAAALDGMSDAHRADLVETLPRLASGQASGAVPRSRPRA